MSELSRLLNATQPGSLTSSPFDSVLLPDGRRPPESMPVIEATKPKRRRKRTEPDEAAPEVLLDSMNPIVYKAADEGVPIRRRRPPVGGTKIAMPAADYVRLGGTLSSDGKPAHTRSTPRTEGRAEEAESKGGESLLASIGNTALSGIGAIGNLLDLVPSMVRDVATLDNPFDQLLSPLSAENRNTGRDVLTKWGVTAPNDPNKWEPADFAGFGLDVLSGVPLGILNLGASAGGNAAKIARSAGLMDDVAKVAPKTMGPREARIATTLDDLVRTRPGEVGPLPGAVPAVDDFGAGATTAPRLPIDPDGPAWDLERGRAVAEAAKGAGLDMAAMPDDSLNALLSESLGGLASVGIPFGRRTVIGTGDRGRHIARALDGTAAGLKASAPVRMVRSLFDPAVQGKTDRWGQAIAEQAYAAKPEARRAAMTAAADISDRLDEVNVAFEQEFGDAVRRSGEVVGNFAAGDVVYAADRNNYGRVLGAGRRGARVEFISPETGARAVADLPLEQLSKASGDAADDVAHRATMNVLNRTIRFAAERGGDVDEALKRTIGADAAAGPELADLIRTVGDDMQTANRSLHQSIVDKGGSARFLDESELFEGGFEHLPRYVDEAQQASLDRAGPRLLGTRHAGQRGRHKPIARLPADVVNELLEDPAARGPDAAEHIANAYRRFLDPNYAGDYPGDFTKHAEDLAAYVAGRPRKQLFTRSTLDDFTKYQLGGQMVSRSLDAIHATVAKNLGDDGIDLASAFTTAGMQPAQALEHLSRMTGRPVAELATKKLPPEIVNAIAGVFEVGQNPGWAREVVKAIDSATKTFKSAVTLPFLAFHSRNFTSGQTVNLSTGLVNTLDDLRAYRRSFRDVATMLRQGVKPEFMRELKIQGVLPEQGFLDTPLPTKAGNQGPASPFDLRTTYREASERVADTPSAVDRLPGGTRARRGWQTVRDTGAKASENVEFMNRVPMYVYLRSKGWTPARAAEKVTELHFDYSDVAPFERHVMKRLIPFYTFTRKAMPLMLGTLYERPGGLMAQSIRAMNLAGGHDASTPDYVAESASIPLGTGPDGTKSYLTGFGLLPEDPLSFFGQGVRGAGLETLSRLNPLVKGPLEWFTGESFYQKGPDGGRDLDLLDPPLGRTLANISGRDEPVTFPGSDALEFVLANSPLARVVSTARTLTDDRKSPLAKAVNLATGLRTAEVSPMSQDIALQERLDRLEKELGGKAFDVTYIPKKVRDAMTPAEKSTVREIAEIRSELERRRKQRQAVKLMAEK